MHCRTLCFEPIGHSLKDIWHFAGIKLFGRNPFLPKGLAFHDCFRSLTNDGSGGGCESCSISSDGRSRLCKESIRHVRDRAFHLTIACAKP